MYSLFLHGRKLVELQKWRHLRVSVNLLQIASAFSNSFSSATVAGVSPKDGRKVKVFTVSYLVDSLGLTRKLADSILRKVSSDAKGNPNSVLNLLSSNGFTDSHISSIIANYPLLLIADAEKSIGPKLQFLRSRGASASELTEIISKGPKILGMKGIAISRYYDFVKEIIEVDKSSKFKKLCHSMPQGVQENKFRNLSVLREVGVPQRLLFHLLFSDFFCGKEKFEECLKKVLEVGFDPTTPKFVDALLIVYTLSDKRLEEKVNIDYKMLGFAVCDVWKMFKKCPRTLTCSEKKIANSLDTFLGLGFSKDQSTTIFKRHPPCVLLSAELVKKKTEFLVKKMNWPLEDLVSSPAVFGLSTEKRIVPRCNVITALLSKGLLGDGGNKPIKSVLFCTDQVFLKRYVRKHDDNELEAELMDIFTTG